MSVFNVGLFKGPRYSSFDWSHGNRISMDAGKINVVGWEYLNTGDKFVLNDVSDVIRQMPMLAPTMDTYKADIHAFAVRLRTIGNVSRNPWVYEDFFNVNDNVDGSARLPYIPQGILLAVNGFKNGTLFEQLGVPTFKKDRDDYLSYIRKNVPWVFDPVVTVLNGAASTGVIVPSSYPVEHQTSPSTSPFSYYLEQDYDYTVATVPYYLLPAGSLAKKYTWRGTLVDYIYQKYPEVFSSFEDLITPVTGVQPNGVWFDLQNNEVTASDFVGTNLLEKVFELYKIDSISVVKEFEDWLLEGLLSLLANGSASTASYASDFLGIYHYDYNSFFSQVIKTVVYAAFPDLPVVQVASSLYDRAVPAYPFLAYWKIVSDWFVNSAIVDPDNYFLSQTMDSVRYNHAVADFWWAYLSTMNELAYRLWENDYFTSAFPFAQIGNAVGIPVNGTIIDLRNANAMQKLRERLMYAGSRIRDVWFAIWGKKTSAAILDMSEVLGAWSTQINVDSVLQTSEASSQSPLAAYAGVGLGYRSGSKGFVYHAEEPTVIVFVSSIKPRASYFQGFSRKLLRSNLYDYAIPQLANVGEQVIYRGELYLGSDSPVTSTVQAQTFGYTRRNGDFMWTPDEVHGDFRGSLDYWHNARLFGSSPSLSPTFLEIHPSEDNLNRIFAVQSDSYNHFLCHIRFDGYVVRSLPKHVVYDL